MENSADYSIKIANYLEDIMSDAEQEAFMEELGNNEELKKQFEDELLLRNLLNKNNERFSSTEDVFLQSADEHIGMVGKAFTPDKTNKKNPAFIIQMLSRYKIVAAAVIGIIAATAALLFVAGRHTHSGNIAGTHSPEDTSVAIDSSNHTINPSLPIKTGQNNNGENNVSGFDSLKKAPIPALAQNKAADSAFKIFYTPYSSKDDPAEISNFYQAYKKGNYAEVLSATEADFQLMGSGNKENMLKQYMQLYKGLSYLAENEHAQAIQQFDQVLHNAGKKDDQFYTAQWYSALTWLKAGDISKASATLKSISGTPSPYASKAAQLSGILNTK